MPADDDDPEAEARAEARAERRNEAEVARRRWLGVVIVIAAVLLLPCAGVVYVLISCALTYGIRH